MNLTALAARYRANLFDSVVPFWLRHSLDTVHGGYFTCLDRAGNVYDDRKYVWLQGRAVWTFSRLYNEVEARPEWLAAAKLGVDFLQRYARDAQGRIYFSLTRDGTPLSTQRKPYAAVFYQMGMAEYARATGDSACRAEAIKTFWQITEWIADPTLLDRPVLAGQTPTSNLANLLVVGLMAYDLYVLDADERYIAIMHQTLTGIVRHYDAEKRVFLENVALDGSDISVYPEGRVFNPGHAIETAWIALRLLEHVPDAAIRQMALDALAGSLERGWDAVHGGIHYFMDLAEKPTLQLESTMKLWWPHAEALYALVLAYTLTRDPRWLTWLERVDAYTFDHFVDAEYGEWFGYLHYDGSRALESKGGNYKGFFHVPRALLFSIQALDGMDTQPKGAPKP